MGTFLFLLAAGLTLFVIRFQVTKAAARKASLTEFTGFSRALAGWDASRDSRERLNSALVGLSIYEERKADFASDPTGRTVPAARAVLASFWVSHLRDAGLLDQRGLQVRWDTAAASFWDSVERLRLERDRLAIQDRLVPAGPLHSNQIIDGLTAALAGRQFATEGAMWEAIAVAFGEVTGRPLDRLDQYDLMLAYAVTTKLPAPTLTPNCT